MTILFNVTFYYFDEGPKNYIVFVHKCFYNSGNVFYFKNKLK